MPRSRPTLASVTQSAAVSAALSATLACLFVSGPARAVLFMDDNPAAEINMPDPAPPAVPADDDLISFVPTLVRTQNRLGIDGAHLLRVADTGQIFTLVITSPSGVRNVSLEALRCNRREYRRLAIGRDDGTWAASPGDAWQNIEGLRVPLPPYRELYDLMCSGGIGISKAATLRQRIRDSNRID